MVGWLGLVNNVIAAVVIHIYDHRSSGVVFITGGAGGGGLPCCFCFFCFRFVGGHTALFSILVRHQANKSQGTAGSSRRNKHKQTPLARLLSVSLYRIVLVALLYVCTLDDGVVVTSFDLMAGQRRQKGQEVGSSQPPDPARVQLQEDAQGCS